jgi:hypothetical protein
MTTYIQNYGFTKTLIKDNNRKSKSEIKWIGDYDGNKANIQLDINDNGNNKLVSIQLDNNDLMNLLGIQPVEMSLENRLSNDFLGKPYKPITLEGALIKNKTRKHKRRHKKYRDNKKKHTYKYKY